jgi:hypothetical protein
MVALGIVAGCASVATDFLPNGLHAATAGGAVRRHMRVGVGGWDGRLVGRYSRSRRASLAALPNPVEGL